MTPRILTKALVYQKKGSQDRLKNMVLRAEGLDEFIQDRELEEPGRHVPILEIDKVGSDIVGLILTIIVYNNLRFHGMDVNERDEHHVSHCLDS
jgi:hypothetical protein